MASTGMDVPTFGVEEELLLVEESTGEPFMESAAVAHVAKTLGLDLDLELTPCQIETATPILDSMADLRGHLVEVGAKPVSRLGRWADKCSRQVCRRSSETVSRYRKPIATSASRRTSASSLPSKACVDATCMWRCPTAHGQSR